jgi:hypothetical protein
MLRDVADQTGQGGTAVMCARVRALPARVSVRVTVTARTEGAQALGLAWVCINGCYSIGQIDLANRL